MIWSTVGDVTGTMRLALTERSIKWLFAFWIVFLTVFLIVVHIRLYHYAFDDAFIHFRVARNFFETGYPYYNTNEMVKVSTSSGWTVFVTILFGIARLLRIDNSFPLFISVINALVTLCGMFVYTRVARVLLTKQIPLSVSALFQMTYMSLLLPASIGLMETPLALLVAGLGIYLLSLSKPSGFALLALAAYIRLELSVLLALTALFTILRRQFRLQLVAGYMAIGSIPLLLYDLYFFHTIIPHSVIAKSIVYSIEWFQPIVYVLFYSLPPSEFSNSLIAFGVGTMLLSIVVMTMLAAISAYKRFKTFWPMLFCLWSFLVAGGYILGHALIFDWYAPLYTIPLLTACLLCAISVDRPRAMVMRLLLYVLALMSAVSMARVLYASIYDPGAFSLFETGSRVKVYLSVGEVLNDEYPNATLLTSEIGGLGYSFEGRILDAAGLASPDSLEFHPMKIPEQRAHGAVGAIPPRYVEAIMPDLIVSYDGFAQALLNDAIVHQYNIVLMSAYLPEDALYSESGAIWNSTNLRIYVRKDLSMSERIIALGSIQD